MQGIRRLLGRHATHIDTADADIIQNQPVVLRAVIQHRTNGDEDKYKQCDGHCTQGNGNDFFVSIDAGTVSSGFGAVIVFGSGRDFCTGYLPESLLQLLILFFRDAGFGKFSTCHKISTPYLGKRHNHTSTSYHICHTMA